MKKIIVSLVALMLLVSGCTPKQMVTESETAAPESSTEVESVDLAEEQVEEPTGTIVVGVGEASGNFNPLYFQTADDGVVVDMVFEGLVRRNFDGEYEGAIATSWEYSNDGKSIVFKLNPEKVFSDGTPVTAADVVFTYQVLADPSYTGRNGATVKDLLGYDGYFKGETSDFEGVVAIDEHTVQFNFSEGLRINFDNCSFYIIPKHYYGKGFSVGNTASVEAITTEPLGSGPYVLKSFKQKELTYLERNLSYVGEGYKIKEVLLKVVEPITDIVELTTGNIDLLATVIEPKKIAEARNAGFNINEYVRSGYGYIKTNCDYGPTSDVQVRKALYYSFNVKEFVNSFFLDKETNQVLATTQYHPFSQVSWAITDDLKSQMVEYDFDLEKAKQILDEAGWVVGPTGFREKNGEVLELKIAAMPEHQILSTLIPMWERDWGQGLNVRLNIAYLEFNTIVDYIGTNSDANVDKWSLFFLATGITTPDPHTLYSSFHSDDVGSGKNNASRYKNSKVDELLDQGKAIMDIEEAKPVYAEIAKILNDEAVMMPVYANTYFDLYSSKIENYQTNSLYNWVKALKDAKVVE